MQGDAAGSLFHGSHLPTIVLQSKHGRQRVFMAQPWNMAAGAEGTFQNVSVRWMTRDATQVQTMDAKCIARTKTRTDVLTASNVVKHKPHRQPL